MRFSKSGNLLRQTEPPRILRPARVGARTAGRLQVERKAAHLFRVGAAQNAI